MNELVEPLLSTNDRHSPLWLKLKRELEARLATLRAQNDGDKDERSTAMLRGRIAELKILLALGNEPTALE